MKELAGWVGIVVGTLVGAFVGGIAGMVALSLVAVAVALAGGSTDSVQTTFTMTLAFVVGAGVVVVWIVGRQVRKANDTAKHRQRLADSERAQAQQDRQSTIASIVSGARNATSAFSMMPVRLRSAAENYARAEAAYRDGAFSPFWSAIERAYAELAEYLASVDEIGRCAESHAYLVRQLESAGGVGADIATFPVQMDARRVRDQHGQILVKLDALVYEAQKQPTFATIWEQRRTTAAVINGFRSLEDAVSTMGTRVTSSLTGLGSHLQATNKEVSRAIAAQTSATTAASEQQLTEMRRIRDEATKVLDHLYYPELSRWLR